MPSHANFPPLRVFRKVENPPCDNSESNEEFRVWRRCSRLRLTSELVDLRAEYAKLIPLRYACEAGRRNGNLLCGDSLCKTFREYKL